MAQLLIPRELRNRDLSTSKLTEVAKRVAIPGSIVGTDWGPVSSTCQNEMAIEFDGWQDGLGQLMLARSTEESLIDGGMLAHTVGGFHLSAMRQIGKPIACSARVLTHNRGWTTMAEIAVGDEVFHPSGRSVTVTEVHPIQLGKDCYEVVTTDGRRLTVDGEHLWTVRDKRSMGHPWRNMGTAEMVVGGLGRSPGGEREVITDGKRYRTMEYRYVLPQQQGLLDLPPVALPVDPYLLGAWLGNGTSMSADLTSGDQDIDHWNRAIVDAGFFPRSTFTTNASGSRWNISIKDDGLHRSKSLGNDLRTLGVLNDKRIPEHYLIGSTEQRLALLQGLLDTDGHITGQQGTVEFCSMTKNLADGVVFLARSLGWRTTMKEGRAKLNGKDYGTKYRVTFTPKLSDPYIPFRLQRKIDRIAANDGGKGRFTVSIKSVERVPSVPVRCIKVDSDDGLFLAGRDLVVTHNSYFFAGSLFGLCQHYPGILIIWSAHHSTTHEETFGAMQGFALRRQIVPFIQKVYTGSGDEEVRFWNGSRILFGARERGFGRGIPGVDVLVCDEGQIMSERARQNMIATMNTSWLGLHIYAGTPPTPEDKSEGWMRKYDEAWVIEDPEIVRVETDDMAWIEFGADDDADLDDVYQWAKNPSVPHRTPFHAMQRLRSNLNDEGFRREGLGLYDKDGGSIFDVARWNTLGVEDAQEPNRVALVLDVGPDRKWAAIAVAGDLVTGEAQNLDELQDEEQRSLVMIISLQKGAVAKIVELNESKYVIDIAITPGAARALETELVKANLEYEILTGTEVSAGYGNLQEAIKTGLVAHLDQPELNYALLNSKSRYLQTGEAESFDRRGYSVDVSPAVAAACALYRWGLLDSPMPFVM